MRNRDFKNLSRSAALFIASIVVAFPGAALATDALWALLEAGGHVVLVRHAITTPGVGDPSGMRIDDCATQRNLTDDGRRHARQIGEAFRARAVRVDRVLSSPWCRCIETAELAFGSKPEMSAALGNLFGRSENRAQQVREMTALVGEPSSGGNLVLVSHGSTISALTGVSLDTGEMVVVTPHGGERFTVAGRLAIPPR
jgi:broad specificity phosphatase PhoE